MTRSFSALLLAVAAGLTLTLFAPTPPADAAPQKRKGKAKGQPAVPARPQSATPANTLKVAKGFKVELLYSVPKDDAGVVGQPVRRPEGPAHRLRPVRRRCSASPRRRSAQTDGERRSRRSPSRSAMAQGLLWAFDTLYVVVNARQAARERACTASPTRTTTTRSTRSNCCAQFEGRRRRARPARGPPAPGRQAAHRRLRQPDQAHRSSTPRRVAAGVGRGPPAAAHAGRQRLHGGRARAGRVRSTT